MAQNAASVVNVLSGGSDSSGGGFSLAGNTYGITDLNATGSSGNTATPTVNSTANYTFVAGDVGHYLHIASGTAWLPGLYPITAVNTGTNVASLGQPDPQVGTFAGCASTASPTAGSGTIMRIRKTAAWTNGTNLTVDGTDNTKVNPDGYTVTQADVGNWIQITTTGTGAAFTIGFYQILVATTGGSQRWKLDRSPAATSSAGATWAMGGALATFSKLASAMVASNRGFVGTGAYSSTASNTFAQTGVTPSNTVSPNRISGFKTLWGDIYQSVPGTWVNNSSRPVLTLSTNSSLTGIAWSNGGSWTENLIIDGGALTGSQGIITGGNSNTIINCWVRNYKGTRGIAANSGATITADCEISGGSSAVTSAFIGFGNTASCLVRCHIHDNACPAVAGNSMPLIAFNLIVNNSGASSDGIQPGTANCNILNNTIYNCGRIGVNNLGTRTDGIVVRNNVIAKSSSYGLQADSAAGAPASPLYDCNAYWSNNGGGTGLNRNNGNDTGGTTAINAAGIYPSSLDVALSADPFVKASVPAADLTVDASNNLQVTSSGYNFTQNDVGATLYITNNSGGWLGPAEFTIASVSGTAAILTASPGATSSSSGNWYFNNFRLNRTISAGASLRAAATPGAFPGTSQLGYSDFGAFQHQDLGGTILAG